MPYKEIMSFRGGINWHDPAWAKSFEDSKQCILMQNYRYHNQFVESIPGSIKHHGTSFGTDPVTAILPYYNDQTDEFKLLAACGDKLYLKDEASNEFSVIADALSPNSIFGSDQRYEVLYIPSIKDGLKKYLGGTQIERVGGGSTQAGNFRQVLYMKEIDRMFGISDDAIFGQITWCNIGDPETWDGANVQRFKLKKGERVECGGILYGKLIVFCTYTIWIYYVSGNEENWKLEEAPTTVGCVAPNTLRKVSNELWFLGDSPQYELGVFSFNGTTCKYLTHDIAPLFKRNNKNNLRNACAEVHDNMYTVSFAHDASEVNDWSIDLDLIHYKEDGTPAIYGPHTFGFYSSCVLNNRQSNREFLMGSENEGFIYKEGGTSFKSTNGLDGKLIENRFLSRVMNEDKLSVLKQYGGVSVFFRPRGYFNAKVRYYISNGTYPTDHTFNPVDQTNIYEKRMLGVPGMSEWQDYLELSAQGTSIQMEILNDVLNGRPDFDGIKYSYEELYETRKIQSAYAQ